MKPSGFDLFVWAASFYGYIVLFAVLLVRQRYKSFPAFTAYIVENIVSTCLLYFALYHLSHPTYFYLHLSLGLVDEVLQLLVFYELAAHVFCPMGVWARDVRKAFLALIAASILLALLLTWLARPLAPLWIQTFLLRSNFFSAAVLSELFVGIMVLSVTVGLPWKTHVARIAQGLGAYSLVCVAKDIVSNYVGIVPGSRTFNDLSHLRILAYLGCEAYWIVMLWQQAPAPRELPEAMRMQIYTLQKNVEDDLIRVRAWRRN